MKINWGTGLVIGMVLFISFILYFVVQIMTDDKHDYDLVVDDYYSREMVYQDELDAESNSHSLEKNIVGKRTESGWLLTFPEDFDGAKISGTVSMYRPSNKKLDFDLPLEMNGNQFLIPGTRMVTGRWNTIVTWKYEGKTYRFTDKITY